MALAKRESDKIEVLETGIIQIRTKIEVYDDEDPNQTIIASNYKRSLLEPGDIYTGNNEVVKSILTLIHTDELKAEYEIEREKRRVQTEKRVIQKEVVTP